MKKKRIPILALSGILLLTGVMSVTSCGCDQIVDNDVKKTGTVTVSTDNHGSVTPSATSGEVGTKITLTVTPSEGYELDTLTHNGNDIKDTLSFTLVEGENKVEATFKLESTVTPPVTETYKVTYTESSDYTISGLNSDGYKENDSVTFSVSVTNSEKEIDKITVDGKEVSGTNGSYTFTMPAHDVAIVISLKSKVETPERTEISWIEEDNLGTDTWGYWSSTKANWGANCVVVMNEAYFENEVATFDYSITENEGVTPLSHAVQIFYKNSKNTVGQVYELTFKLNTQVAGTIKINNIEKEVVAGENDISVIYEEGTLKSSFHLETGLLGSAKISISNVSWKESAFPTYKVTYTQSEDYEITGLNDSYKEGETVTFKVNVLNEDKKLGTVTVDDTPLAANSNGEYSFTMDNDGATIVVNLVDIVRYKVTTTGTGYTINGLNERGYEEGETVTFTLEVTDETKELQSVSVYGNVILDQNGTYSFVMKAEETEIVVTLVDKEEPDLTKYSVTYEENESYTIEGLDEEGYLKGSNVSFTVTVNDETKEVKEVKVGETPLTPVEGTYSFTMPASNVTISVTLEDAKVNLEFGEETSMPNDTWIYWNGRWDWFCNGEAIVNSAYIQGDNIHLDYSINSEGNHVNHIMQLLYKDTSLVTNAKYTLTFNLNSSKSGDIIINEQRKTIVAGENEVSIEFIYDGTASFVLQLGPIGSAIVDISNVRYEKVPESYVVNVNSNSSEYLIEGLEENYFEGDEVKFKVTATNDYILDSVTYNDTVLTADEEGYYTFTMPSQDVEIYITLKDPSGSEIEPEYKEIEVLSKGSSATRIEGTGIWLWIDTNDIGMTAANWQEFDFTADVSVKDPSGAPVDWTIKNTLISDVNEAEHYARFYVELSGAPVAGFTTEATIYITHNNEMYKASASFNGTKYDDPNAGEVVLPTEYENLNVLEEGTAGDSTRIEGAGVMLFIKASEIGLNATNIGEFEIVEATVQSSNESIVISGSQIDLYREADDTFRIYVTFNIGLAADDETTETTVTVKFMHDGIGYQVSASFLGCNYISE
ncbi:MAG: hypothetical protein IAC58_03245 [Firmicutes bacterium]|uniref:Bacterial repeat domain-containing protein n=1 Tax=Candidatus Onthovivens merdipullorum TaxID=2840889 RepID=A0A9D9GUB6_9BACL|nr:hypothetical protein [Candidatus Onthovivens merdipullorum]